MKKDWQLFKRIKTSLDNQKKYKIFKSKQLYGLILVLLFSYFLIVSIVQVSGFTTIYSYTFGFIFGYYSYFIFAGLIYYGLSLLSNVDIRLEKYLVTKYNKKFNFSWITYLFLVIGIALIIESSIFIYREKELFPGTTVFSLTIKQWWNEFTGSSNAALPEVQNSGILVVFLLSLISSWAGFPISIIAGVCFILYFIFYIYYGSIIKLIKNNKNIFKLNKKELKEHRTKILDLSFENDNVLEDKFTSNEKDKTEEFQKTVTINISQVDSIFSIDDLEEEVKTEAFIEQKTTEFNIQNNLNQDVNIDKMLTKHNKFSQPETFEFELNIFDTLTTNIDQNDVIDIDTKD